MLCTLAKETLIRFNHEACFGVKVNSNLFGLLQEIPLPAKNNFPDVGNKSAYNWVRKYKTAEGKVLNMTENEVNGLFGVPFYMVTVLMSIILKNFFQALSLV